MPHASNNGVKIWWESRGEGEPIVLLNGLTSPSEAWYRVTPHLEAGYRVLLIDNRGVGRSDVPKGRYTVTTMAKDALTVMDEAGVASAHIMGISMGSCIAQELALLAPSRVRSLVLAASNPGSRSSTMPSRKALWLVATCGMRDHASLNRDLVPFTYHPTTDRARIDEDMTIARGTAPTKRGLRGQTFGCMGWDRFTQLGTITAPALVLHGADDLLDPAANGEKLAAALPNAQLEILPNASHQVFTDQEDAAMKAVLTFLETASA